MNCELRIEKLNLIFCKMKLELFINHKKRKIDFNHDDDSLINMNITSLEGLLPSLQDLTTLYIKYNSITSLDGLPPMLTKLNISYNRIKSLEGLPATLIFLDISQNHITSLEGLPPMLTYLTFLVIASHRWWNFHRRLLHFTFLTIL